MQTEPLTSGSDLRVCTNRLQPLRPTRSGSAILLVLVVIVATALITSAVLSTASLQAHGRSELTGLGAVDDAADDGVLYAMHELRRTLPADALLNPDSSYWSGATSVAIGADTLTDISVTRVSPSRFAIESFATDTAGRERASQAQVQIVTPVWQGTAGLHLGELTTRLGSTVTVSGDLWSDGNFFNSGTVTGTVMALNSGVRPDGEAAPDIETLSLIQAADQSLSYYYEGNLYTGEIITSPLSSVPVANPATNPAGVFFYLGTSDLILRCGPTLADCTEGSHCKLDDAEPTGISHCKHCWLSSEEPDGEATPASSTSGVIKGTIVAANAGLTIEASVSVAPVAGMPAVISRGGVTLNVDAAASFTGVVFIGGDVVGTDADARLEIDGALIANPPTSRLADAFSGSLQIVQDSTNLSLPNFVVSDAVELQIVVPE